MALHGHTTIELTNTETGEKRVYEDDNIVTNALQFMLARYVFESTTPYSKIFSQNSDYQRTPRTDSFDGSATQSERVMRMLTGGLILLDSQLDENVNNVSVPGGVHTVGCGTTMAYSGINTMVGSYNIAESGKVDNGWRHVWDFGTSHGNGQIACACLTTREGGFAGAGTYPYDYDYRLINYKSVSVDSNDIITSRGTSLHRRPCYGYEVYNYASAYMSNIVLWADVLSNSCIMLKNDNDWYVPQYNLFDPSNVTDTWTNTFIYTKKLTFRRYRFPFTAVSIFDEHDWIEYNNKILEEFTIEMPDTLKAVMDNYITTKGYFRLYYKTDGDNIYVIFYKNQNSTSATGIPANDKIHVWKINVVTKENEHFAVANTLNKTIHLYKRSGNSYSYYSLHQIGVVNDKLVVFTAEEGYAYLINMHDATDVMPVLYPDGTQCKIYHDTGTYGTSGGFTGGFALNGKYYFYAGSIYMVIDSVTGIASYRGYATHTFEGTDYNSCVVKNSGGLIISNIYTYPSDSDYYIPMLRSNFLRDALVTINNLATPVTKTAAETMKVTYTLTQDLYEA